MRESRSLRVAAYNSLDRSPDESGCLASNLVRRWLREFAPPASTLTFGKLDRPGNRNR